MMNPPIRIRQNLPVMMLGLVAVALLAAIYFLPTWWVALKAPNYPPEAFPDGVRIHFHMNGVFNGCQKIESTEIHEDQALDCVHEMDTINHYVGMYPIAAGGVIERAFSPFLISMLGVMVIGFACSQRPLRVGIMGVGFAAIIGWMGMTFFSAGGLKYQNTGYVESLITSMDQEAGSEEAEPEPTGIVARLKAEMAAVEARERGETAAPAAKDRSQSSAKTDYINSLRVTYQKDRERRGANAVPEWAGSGHQVLLWHYEKSLGRYFNNPVEIRPLVSAMNIASYVVFFGIIAAMLVLLFGALRGKGPFYWLLAAVPALLPVFFIIDYSAWLWWYGHRLNDMGAFTVKPFMPTVFGDGKVAQFSTHSYPYWGFGVMLVLSVVIALMVVLRRKQLNRSAGG
ncbi:MAG: hypothetical protein KIS75_04210 [Chromatiales bacterium]|nr:hypothetical protein [Chromatiales bacterium]